MPDLTPVQGVVGVFGALTAGGFLTTVWTTLFGRKSRKMNETKELQALGKEIRDEVRADNERLNKRLDIVIKALNNLSDAVDDFLIFIAVHSESTVPDDARRKLRDANNEAKRAA